MSVIAYCQRYLLLHCFFTGFVLFLSPSVSLSLSILSSLSSSFSFLLHSVVILHPLFPPPSRLPRWQDAGFLLDFIRSPRSSYVYHSQVSSALWTLEGATGWAALMCSLSSSVAEVALATIHATVPLTHCSPLTSATHVYQSCAPLTLPVHVNLCVPAVSVLAC